MDANHPMAELASELQRLSMKADEKAGRSQVVPAGVGASGRPTDTERNKRAAARSDQLSDVVARLRETAARSRPRSTQLLAASEVALLPAPEREPAPQPQSQSEAILEPEAEPLDECAGGPEREGQCSRVARLDDQVLYRQRVAAFFNPGAGDADADVSPNTPPPSSSNSTASTVASHSNAPASTHLLPLRLVGDVRERTTEPLPDSRVFSSTARASATCEQQSSALAPIAEDSRADEEAIDQQRALLASPD